jgi:hypothetical protein
LVRWRPALSENVAMAITPLSQAQKRPRATDTVREVCVLYFYGFIWTMEYAIYARHAHGGMDSPSPAYTVYGFNFEGF